MGTSGSKEENPLDFYGTAIRRHAKHVWNLRISHPHADILQHSDDINPPFRQILYHLELAPVFGYVFSFGSRSATLWWCQPSECWAHGAAVLNYNSGAIPLTDRV
jgi:hypothetical protein